MKKKKKRERERDVGLMPGQESLLVKEVATLSSILAWEIP